MLTYDRSVTWVVYPVPNFKKLEPEISEDYNGHGDYDCHDSQQ
jgi:hypothetical protein